MSSLTPKHDVDACKSAGDCYRTTLNNLKALLKEVEECDRQTKTEKNKCSSETFPPDWSVPVITYPITPQREKEYFMNLKMPWERQHSQIIAGKYYICSCVKRDGLQADCPLVGCQGSELCLTKPYPICPPSGNAETNVTPEMAECLLSGLQPNNPSLEVTECKENEPCNVKCAECNSSLQNICKWNPDFFNSTGKNNNDAYVPAAPPTKDTVPCNPIVSNDKMIDPSTARINVQFRMIGLINGMNNQNMADPCKGMNGDKIAAQYNGMNNQNIMADPCNSMNSNKIAVQYNGMNNQNIMADPCKEMNGNKIAVQYNGMNNQNIMADPCNSMNSNKIAVQYNGMNNQNNMADPCNPCIGMNGGNKTAVQYNRTNNQNMADLNKQNNMRVPYNGTNQINMPGLSTMNNGQGNMFDSCNGMNKTANPGIGLNNQNYMVAPNNVASNSNKLDYFNKIVELCSRVHNMDNQSNGMNNQNNMTNQTNQMRNNIKMVDPCNGMNNQNNMTNQTNQMRNNIKTVDPCNGMNNQNNMTNQTNQMRNNIKTVDPCNGMNNQNNVVVPNNVANQRNGYNKIVEVCARVHYNMPAQINGMNNNNNRIVDPCNGMNNQNNISNQMTNQTNQMNRVVDQCNGMNNGKPVNIGMNSYKMADTCNGVNNQNNMVVPYNSISQNNTPTPYNPGKKTEPCSKMVLKFTMVDPNKSGNGKMANQCNGGNSNKMTNPCNGMNNQNIMPVRGNGLNNNGKVAVQNNGMNQNMMADPCNGVNNGKIAVQYNGMNNGLVNQSNRMNNNYMVNQSNGMNNGLVNQSNKMNNNYMANQSNGMNNNRMPIKRNGLNDVNTIAVPTNGNQPTCYTYNCSPCSTNPNLFWCTMQK